LVRLGYLPRPRLLSGLILGAGVLVHTLSFAGDDSRVFVFVEVPSTIAAVTTLEIASLELVGADRTIPLPPARRDLPAEELAGSQVLLAAHPVPAGHYTGLRLVLAAAESRVGVAPVTPRVDPGGQLVPLETSAGADRAAMVFLEWTPRPLGEDDLVFEASLAAVHHPIPPTGSLAFVSCGETGSVMVVDRLRGRVVGALPLDADPRGMAFVPGDRTLFVALAGRDALAEVDGLSLQVRRVVPLSFGDEPDRLLLADDRATLFVLNRGSRTVLGLDTWSLQERFRAPVGEGPRGMAQDPVSRNLYVACEDEGRVLVLESGSGGQVTALGLGAAPREVAVDPRSNAIFVGDGSQRRIHVLDLGTGAVTTGPNICGTVASLAFNPGSDRLFAAVPGCRSLAVLQPRLGLEFAALPVPGRPGLMVFDSDFRQLLVVFPDQGLLAVCNPNRGTVGAVVEVGGRPYAVAAP
jgi:DNA-binding beta-propeller fold protein YncE